MNSGVKFLEEKERFLNMSLEEKRKRYKVNPVPLENVVSWNSYYLNHTDRLNNLDKDYFINQFSIVIEESKPHLNEIVSLWKGDITKLEVDAVVCAASNALLGGFGVDGAIHRAAGEHLYEECKYLQGCVTGDAKITGGYQLPARYIIHTVGPRGEEDSSLRQHLLNSCYEKCLRTLVDNDLRTIAFPCISTGIFGYPKDSAASVALKTVRDFLECNYSLKCETTYLPDLIELKMSDWNNGRTTFAANVIVPRCKEWLPLATNQLRLRNLIQILAFSIRPDSNGQKIEKGLKHAEDQKPKSMSYYYTLHSTTMSAPFYTSEKVCNDSPKWKEIEVNTFLGKVSNSADAFVIRLWSTKVENEDSEDQVIAVWGVHLSGLIYLGQSLGADIPLKPNSIVFLMLGGYFTDINCLEPKPKIRYISVSVNQSDIQPSYTVNTLTRLHTIQQVIKKEVAEVDLLKQKISMGDFFRTETRGRTMLRRLLSKNKPRVSHQDYVRVKENIEVAKYRVQILREEKSILSSKLEDLKSRIETLSDENHVVESKIMENYRLLMRKVQVQRELKRDHISRREIQLHSKAKLNFRAKQLISELSVIYPIVEKSPEKFTICGVHLPNSEDFAGHDEVQISVALGFVTHVIQMISVFLQIPLRYPVIHYGSRSRIIDHITDGIPDSEREFPLYMRGKEKVQFHYAVYLLNKNIAQLRWLCGLPTADLRNTLSNLSSLVKMKSDNSNLDHSNRSVSSSTADVCSSCLSMSSPVGSVLSLSNKKHMKSYRVSESYAEVARDALTPFKPSAGHRISKSVGSAKDMNIGGLSVKDQTGQFKISGVRDGINRNISCSLDKGLNKYENGLGPKRETGIREESNPCPGRQGTETGFHGSEVVDKFQEPRKDVQNSVEFSVVTDTTANGFRGEVATEVSENVEIKGVSDDDKADEREVITYDSGYTELASEVVEGNVIDPDLNCDRNIVTGKEVQESNEGTCLTVTDSLFESVTSRTEALANQSTSFNMFRSRYNSTVENSS